MQILSAMAKMCTGLFVVYLHLFKIKH